MDESIAKKKPPRGIRNNNPLNIRKGSSWKGERPIQTDRAFEEFQSMEYGVRAAFYILRKYMSGYFGLTKPFNTIELIIRRWAPATENNTEAYIDHVCVRTGIPRSRKLSFENKKTMCDLVAAMVVEECGQSIDRSIIESAYDML